MDVSINSTSVGISLSNSFFLPGFVIIVSQMGKVSCLALKMARCAIWLELCVC